MKKLFLVMLAAGFVSLAACTSGNKESSESTDSTAIEETAPAQEEMAPAEEEMSSDSTGVEADSAAVDGM